MKPNEVSDIAVQNRLLTALSCSEFSRLRDDFELVSFSPGEMIYRAGEALDCVYFPTTCIVALVFATQSGGSSELAMTGNDGLVGIPLVLGGGTTTHYAVVQSRGAAFRLKGEVMRWELEQNGELHRLALRYTQALITQLAQNVVCNRHHAVDQQLCRWLLLSHDRTPGNQLNITQELIANMLGVRREAVTEAARKLQHAGLILYSRGRITITNRAGLEARACECYSIVEEEYTRLFHELECPRVKTPTHPHPLSIRHRAEVRLSQKNLSPAPATSWEKSDLVHELEVHQIELEMRNEELERSYQEVELLRERYTDIYDFSPVSYFTLDANGVILDLNLTGAILLGIKRTQRSRFRFAAFVSPPDLPVFNQFCTEVLQGSRRNLCQIRLIQTGHHPAPFVRIEAISDERNKECRMVVINITESHAELAILESSELRHRNFIEKLPLSIAIGQNGVLKYLNPKGAELIGYTPDEWVGKSYLPLIYPEDHPIVMDSQMCQLVCGEGGACCELRLITKTGRIVDCRLYVSAIQWEEMAAALVVIEDITAYKKIDAELRRLATTDTLTKLPNRGCFIGRMEEALSRLKRGLDSQTTILMLDIDYFKLINDSFGHPVGDAVLQFFAQELHNELRAMDTSGRIGGEEFAVLLPETSPTEAVVFAERFMKRLTEMSMVSKGRSITVTVSIGIAALNINDTSSDQGLSRADTALYQAKTRGRNRIELFSEDSSALAA